MTFTLHPRLKQDCIEIGRFELNRLLMMNDLRYPWFILVPERPAISEIYQLDKHDRLLMLEESCYLSEKMVSLYHPDKLNIGSLGNIVPQLHLHHIARYRTDSAWPGPVWGKGEAVHYTEQQIHENIDFLAKHLTRLKQL